MWLALFFALEVGWLPSGAFVIYEPEWNQDVLAETQTINGSFYTDLQAELVAWGHIYIGGGIKTYVWSREGEYTFWPNTTLYNFGTGLRFGLLDIGWRHYCMHPVMPYLIAYEPRLKKEGAYNEIFLRVQGNIKGTK